MSKNQDKSAIWGHNNNYFNAKSDIKSIKRAFSAGATDYVSKPFEIHEVSARIRVASELSSSRNEIRALRCRAKIDKRKIKAETSDKFGVAGNKIRDPCRQSKTENCNIADTSGGWDWEDILTRDEIVQLFSKDFSDLAYLYRRRRKKRAC